MEHESFYLADDSSLNGCRKFLSWLSDALQTGFLSFLIVEAVNSREQRNLRNICTLDAITSRKKIAQQSSWSHFKPWNLYFDRPEFVLFQKCSYIVQLQKCSYIVQIQNVSKVTEQFFLMIKSTMLFNVEGSLFTTIPEKLLYNFLSSFY